METSAIVRGVRLSAQKGRLVADLVRGKPVDKALNILTFTQKKAALIIKKALESAIANAEHNDGADIDELRVTKIHVEKAKTLRRFGARAKGRGTRINKQTCHMGQKINPTGFRLPVTRDWTSRWYAEGRNFARTLGEDLKVRTFLQKKLRNASVSRILIERPAKNARITIYSARPGVVIGKQGQDIEVWKNEVQKMMGVPVHVNIEEIRRPELDAQLIADSITQQLEKRVMFRRAMKRAMQNAMRLGAQGIKIMSAGRLNGAEIARTEWYREGRVPLHTLRANIDYGFSEANTTYGVIGVKVWVYKGDNFGEEAQAQEKTEREDRRSRRPAGERAAKPARRARKTAEKTEAAAADGEKAEKKPARRTKKAAAKDGE